MRLEPTEPPDHPVHPLPPFVLLPLHLLPPLVLSLRISSRLDLNHSACSARSRSRRTSRRSRSWGLSAIFALKPSTMPPSFVAGFQRRKHRFNQAAQRADSRPRTKPSPGARRSVRRSGSRSLRIPASPPRGQSRYRSQLLRIHGETGIQRSQLEYATGVEILTLAARIDRSSSSRPNEDTRVFGDFAIG